MTPRISVLMAVYNGGSFLSPAIESVLRQSEKRFEFLIVDDGSSDNSVATVERFKDSRIRLIRHKTNQGLAASLNSGLAQARGDYIARLDADDLALPDRLARQAEYLDRHPEIGLVGSNAILVDEEGRRLYQTDYPRSPLAVRWVSLLQNPFIHSTVMLRRALLEQHSLRYDPRLTATQDYDFWLRCLEHTEAANLTACTVFLRRHGASISSQRADTQRRNTVEFTGAAIKRCFGFAMIEAEDRAAIFDAIFGARRDAVRAGVDRVYAANRYYDLLEAFLGQRPEGDVMECRRRVCTRVAQMVLYPPFPKGALSLLIRSLRIDPALPLHLLRFAAFRIEQGVKRGKRVSLSVGPVCS